MYHHYLMDEKHIELTYRELCSKISVTQGFRPSSGILDAEL